MKHILILFLLFIIGCKSQQIGPAKAIEKLGANPYFMIDEQPVDKSELMKYEPTSIALVTTYYDKDAIKNFGDKAKDGAVLILTKSFATNKYETLFKSFSKDYEKVLIENNKNDIQYILNDRILIDKFEGTLASIDNKLLKNVKIIDQKTLAEKFQITNKKVGILIKSKRNKDVYDSKKKF